MDLWLGGPETRKLLEKCVAEWHPHLAAIDQKIAILFREPAAKSGGVVSLGTVKKASPVVQALGVDAIFILEIASVEWLELSEPQRLALMDHLLCQCGIKKDEEKEGITYCILKPEVHMFIAEVKRHGVWRDFPEEEDAGAAPTATIEAKFQKFLVESTKELVSAPEGE